MSKIRIVLLYLIFFIAVTGGFSYYLFPSDSLKKYITDFVRNANSDINLTINQIKPAFPPCLKFDALSFFYLNKPVFDIDYLKVTPQPQSLFTSKPVLIFKGKSCEGMIIGKADVVKSELKSPTGTQLSVDADLSGIRIKNIKALKNLSEYKISGVLDGKITYSNTKTESVCNAKLILSDSGVEVVTPFFNINSITFKSINADITIPANKNLQIKECKFTGSQLEGVLTGSVEIKDPMLKSNLNLSGTFKVYPSLMAKLGSASALLFKKKSGDSGFSFKIGGTIENPDFSLK